MSLVLLSVQHTEVFPAPDVGAGSNKSEAVAKISADTEAGRVFAVWSSQNDCQTYAITQSEGDGMIVDEVDVGDFQFGGDCTVSGFQFVPDLSALCMTFASGEIRLLKFGGGSGAPSRPEVEIVGTVDRGIEAMEWSPDFEVVVMVTGGGTLLAMNKDFNVLAEVPIDVEDSGEDKFVNVGWGKKETQFHGSEGKQAALKAKEVATSGAPPAKLSADDDGCTRVSWRGDGAYFVCSSITGTRGSQRRILRVYNRECVLQSSSETVDQLEHSLNWRPSGNLIASTQRHPVRHDVVFFERNGLRHGEFSLRESGKVKIRELSWNLDSSLLAVWIDRYDESGKPGLSSAVQLWGMSNYYWYLKHEISLPGEGPTSVAAVLWDTEAALRLHLLSDTGRYYSYEFCSDTFTSTSVSSMNPASVAIIDGTSIHVTPFKHQNVPPPMSSFKLAVPKCASHVAYGPPDSDLPGDDIAVLVNSGTVAVFKSMSVQKPVQPHKLRKILHLPTGYVYRQAAWMDPNTITAVAYNLTDCSDSLIALTIPDGDGGEVDVKGVVALEDQKRKICRILSGRKNGQVFVEFWNGDIAEVQQSATGFRTIPMLRFPSLCFWIGSASAEGSEDETINVIVGLNDRNKLYLNDQIVASDCTSFFIHKHFLIYSTFHHSARFVSLQRVLFDSTHVEADLEFDENNRRVERGAKIVTATMESALVLQMPRGNLETIHPRALVLWQVRSALSSFAYREAFMLCRKHRIDINLLVDHDRDSFCKHTDLFCRELKEVDYLNLFLSGLRNEDVTKTMYPYGYSSKRPATNNEFSQVDKVNEICDRVRSSLEKLDVMHYVESILTAHAKRNPPDLDAAMRLIRKIKRDVSTEASEKALKYIIFLVNADRLYDVALGLYDFELVIMVAQHSQKDPREYLSFLKELRQLPKEYQRFRINDHLARYDEATRYLCSAGDDHLDECIKYVVKHKLYSIAAVEFKAQPQKYRNICKLYGDYLEDRSCFIEAALAYLEAEELNLAMESYQRGGQWEELFALAYRLNVSEDQVRALARQVIVDFESKRRFREAAHIALDYLGDIAEAVSLMLKGMFWSEAARVSYKHGRVDLVTSQIKPGVLEGHKVLMEEVKEVKKELWDLKGRYDKVKEERERPPDPGPLEVDDALENIDVASDTTSMMTRTTRRTGMTGGMTNVTGTTSKTMRTTAKARRKLARRRAAGKMPEFEGEFILNSLNKIIENFNRTQVETTQLVRALVSIRGADLAHEIQVEHDGLRADLTILAPIIFAGLNLPTANPGLGGIVLPVPPDPKSPDDGDTMTVRPVITQLPIAQREWEFTLFKQ
ncbi:IKI3 family-domain-containing protein [Cladochytrium replicatum]|nr:IKI3 family-domain-containing protein [Cladochytrium replicatum]